VLCDRVVTGTVTLRHVSLTGAALPNTKPLTRYLRPSGPTEIGGMYVAKQAVAVSFPGATPAKLELRIIGGALGDFGVFAIPYPAGTTFSVTLWGSRLVPASSIATMDGALLLPAACL
jgi:hypothetical protein